MYKPELYCRYNQIAHVEAKWALKNYLHYLNIKGDGSAKILEIGCGPADVTETILLPYLPEALTKFVSSDISEEMIKYAKVKSKNSKIVYKILDISTKKDLTEFGVFNHIFSFLTLQLVHDQRQALKNIHKLLSSGGNIFLTHLPYAAVFYMYEHMVKKGLWLEYMHDYMNFSPYFKSQYPKNEFKILLEEEGFTINFIEIFDKSETHPDLDSFRGLVVALNPFLKRIPKVLHENYIEDLLSAATELGYIGSEINYKYSIIITVATKI